MKPKLLIAANRIFLLFLLLNISHLAFSQDTQNKVNIEEVVNSQVWRPFKEAFDNRDWKSFNDLHTDDVLRVSKWGIKLGSEYKEQVKNGYQKKNDATRTIDFWLEQRLYSGDTGYEVGYYRVTSKPVNGEVKSSYARFHVVLKKINGFWKIAQDWDTKVINGIPITVNDFKKGTPLGFK